MDCVAKHAPGLEAYARASYGSPSNLYFGKFRLQSSSGVQQGDPLGQLLFAISIFHLSNAVLTSFSVWYLDDATLGGNLAQIVKEIRRIKEEAGLIGLELNNTKCESISKSELFNTAVEAILPGSKNVDPND